MDRALFIAAGVVLLEALALAVTFPVLPAYVEGFGGHVAWAGVLMALATLPRIFTAPLWGKFADRFGRKIILQISTVGTLLSSVGWALAMPMHEVFGIGLLWLAGSRLLLGLFGAQALLTQAVASDVTSKDRRTAAMGMLGASFGVAFSAGPAMGGLLAQYLGPWSIGVTSASLQGLSLLLITWALRETVHRPDAQDAAERATPQIAKLRYGPILRWLGVVLLVSAAYSVLMPTFEPLVDLRLNWSVAQAGYALAWFGLLGAVVQGVILRQITSAKAQPVIIVIGLFLTILGLVGIALPIESSGLLIGTLSVLAIGVGLAVPTLSAQLSTSASRHTQGRVHGLTQSATAIGRSGGYLMGGSLFYAVNAMLCYLVAAGLTALGLLLVSAGRDKSSDDVDIEPTIETP